MIFKVYKSSDRGFNDGTPTEINTLEELIQFMDKQENPIIIDREYKKEDLTIEIYDDYRE